jgi:hypothetical protein
VFTTGKICGIMIICGDRKPEISFAFPRSIIFPSPSHTIIKQKKSLKVRMTVCQVPEEEEAVEEAPEAALGEEALVADPEEAALAADITEDLEVPRAEATTQARSTAAFSDREDIITEAAVDALADLPG